MTNKTENGSKDSASQVGIMHKVSDVLCPRNSKRKVFAKSLFNALGEPKTFLKNLNWTNINQFFYYLKNEEPAYLENILEKRESKAYKRHINIKNFHCKIPCPCCAAQKTKPLITIDGYDYFHCKNCDFIFIDPDYLEKIDNGFNLVDYGENYWNQELPSAKERSYGPAIARMAEVLHYARKPVHKFLDIGTGPGYFLDAVGKYLPGSVDIFYGVEKYPPPTEYRTKSKNYILGDLRSINFKVDAGMCMEMIEHLTPNMLKAFFKDLAAISNKEAIYIINTGMPEFVLNEDIKYLDPKRRGHIVSYSTKAVELIAKEFGFSVFPIKGKSWAFIIEFESDRKDDVFFRIWSILDHNKNILTDEEMGTALKILGLETARAGR